MFMESRIITKENTEAVAEMERFVLQHEKGHFLQQPRWAQVKTRWKWRGILALGHGELVGVMSVLVRPLPLGVSLMYAPRGPVCDRNDPYVLAELFAAADRLAKEEKALELLLDPDESDANQSFRRMMEAWAFWEREDAGFNNIQAQHVLRLYLQGKTEESVFGSFSPKTRYNIRLAMRRGVRIRACSGDGEIPEDALTAFDRIMQETGERDHFIARGKEYYRTVLQAMGRDAVLYLAYLQDEPIAGTIGVFSGGKGWYLYGASSNAHRNAMPNYLLQWEMVRRALGQQCVFYDFRGVPGQPRQDDPLYGLYRFKKGFGGTYTKFTGLFVRRYRPVLADCLEIALGIRRRLEARHCRIRDKMPIEHR